MPRKSQPTTAPSAGNKYAVTRGDRNSDQQLRLGDVTTADRLWALVEDCTLTGVSVTISATKDLQTLAVTFFHDGTRYPWYLQSEADWQEMVQAIEG
jgi:hypothetical protein